MTKDNLSIKVIAPKSKHGNGKEDKQVKGKWKNVQQRIIAAQQPSAWDLSIFSATSSNWQNSKVAFYLQNLYLKNSSNFWNIDENAPAKNINYNLIKLFHKLAWKANQISDGSYADQRSRLDNNR